MFVTAKLFDCLNQSATFLYEVYLIYDITKQTDQLYCTNVYRASTLYKLAKVAKKDNPNSCLIVIF